MMATLIQYDSSPMGERSISRRLTADFARTWLKSHPNSKIVTRDLAALELPRVDALWISAAHTPEETHTEDQKKALAVSDSLIADLKHGDRVCALECLPISGVPSTLKLWIDQVARAGKTFSYTANGPTGLLTGKKATFLPVASRWRSMSKAPAWRTAFNFVAPYLQAVFGFLGITDLTIISAEAHWQPMSKAKWIRTRSSRRRWKKVQAHASL